LRESEKRTRSGVRPKPERCEKDAHTVKYGVGPCFRTSFAIKKYLTPKGAAVRKLCICLLMFSTASGFGQTLDIRSQLGPAVNVRGLAIPRPIGSKVDLKEGPPDTIDVQFDSTPTWFREFYRAALRLYRWMPEESGVCWLRTHPLTHKTIKLCLDVDTPQTAKLRLIELQ